MPRPSNIILIIIAVLIITPKSTLASNHIDLDTKKSGVASATAERQQLIREKIQTLKDQTASRQAERQQRITEQTKQKIQNRFQIMTNRMQAALNRFHQITNRIASRIEKLSQEGVETDELTLQLTNTQESLNQIEATLDAAKTEFDKQVLQSDSPKQGFTVIKDTIKDFVTSLKEIHAQLRDLVVQIRVTDSQSNQTEKTDT